MTLYHELLEQHGAQRQPETGPIRTVDDRTIRMEAHLLIQQEQAGEGKVRERCETCGQYLFPGG